MGNNNSALYQDLVDEYNRLQKERQNPFIILEDILKFSRPREYPVDVTHLGTLFMMDQTKDGKFWVEEIVDFAALYAEKQAAMATAVDFLKEFQGYCTIQMWNVVSRANGDQLFVTWFCNLFAQGSRVEVTERPDVEYISKGTLKTLHEILNIDKTYGIEFLSFYDLVQRTAEELNLTCPTSVDAEDVIPLEVVRMFAKDFINGFISYMRELGFEDDIDVS